MEKILDWDKYSETAKRLAAEGSVLLTNLNHALPLESGTRVSVFGRIQEHYYKSGTGSGGMVNVHHCDSILESIRKSDRLVLNEKLADYYAAWSAEHPFDEGSGWGGEPWSQEEMKIPSEVVSEAADQSDAAIVIFGRTAGEDRDASNRPGSYQLTDIELGMLREVRAYFDKVIVLLNTGSLVDLSFMDAVNPDAVVLLWQGGMMGGPAAVDVVTGVIPPSGHLTDTIAYDIEDYPSAPTFGDEKRNCYAEDIYVGYRYFNTFSPDKVRFPFGYGLTYTEFDLERESRQITEEAADLVIRVKNTGNRAGRCVVQIYAERPQGTLGQPRYVLADFAKTPELAPQEETLVSFHIAMNELASYDDTGSSGYKDAFVLEAGKYYFFFGEDSMDLTKAGSVVLEQTRVVRRCEAALSPTVSYKRMKPMPSTEGEYKVTYETVEATPDRLKLRQEDALKEITQTGNRGLKLTDENVSVEDFVAQLTDEELCCMVRGEGMGSSLVTAGTASAFGGVSEALRDYGIPAICTDDGPSGMRLDCGKKAFSLPNGTLLASSFDEQLIEELYYDLGLEMTANRVDALLGPGINIHRHPLNGRNFEYFSEDPLVTGRIAAAQINGLHRGGATGVLKHFAANNQEFHRRALDSQISRRALWEIYLRGYAIAIEKGGADAIMTTYGMLNGQWTASDPELTTTALRKYMNFHGVVMTDWWACLAGVEGSAENPPNNRDFVAMVNAQNDLYMVCPNGAKNLHGDNLEEGLRNGTISRAALQRSAVNICEFALHTEAMRRMKGYPTPVTILNCPKDEDEVNLDDITYINLGEEYEEDLSGRETKKDCTILIPLIADRRGIYELSVTAESDLSELAQMPVSVFYSGIPIAVMTFQGTGGKEMTITREVMCRSRFVIFRLRVGSNGLQLKNYRLKFIRDFRKGDPFV